MTFDVRHGDFDYFIVLNDLVDGGRKAIPFECKAQNVEDAFKVLMLKQDMNPVKLNAGMSDKTFENKDYSKYWMYRRIESISRCDFEEVMTKGVPDFVVGRPDNKKLAFFEIKSRNDSLRVSQMKWMNKFQNLPLKMAYIVSKNEWFENK